MSDEEGTSRDEAGTGSGGTIRKPQRRARAVYVPVLAGAIYGLLMRLAFGGLSFVSPWLNSSSDTAFVMSTGFVLMTPVVLGAITVYVMRAAPGRRGPTWLEAAFVPWGAAALMMVGALLTLLEGGICVVILSPVFLVLASVGGLLMNLVLKTTRVGRLQAGALATLPLLFTMVEGPLTVEEWQRIDRSVVVEAAPARVWSEIVAARDIRREEFPRTWIHLIGVPRPVEGVNHATPQGEVRESRWERGVHFLGRVTERVEGRRIAWRYEFSPDSFPPGTMDDHVVIGGRYFDLGETRFSLTPLAATHTRLDIEAHYRVTSSINVYAVPVADFLGRDFVDGLLTLYKRRSET
ncbi:SRPBCC family protein [Roseateles chitinivorans]|uniref:SRPBCC family protein n=1 Tax=Roseateles chitinivorans TaxID=2917965 RepID=UPI003D66847D